MCKVSFPYMFAQHASVVPDARPLCEDADSAQWKTKSQICPHMAILLDALSLTVLATIDGGQALGTVRIPAPAADFGHNRI
jgi:hypothetical protein